MKERKEIKQVFPEVSLTICLFHTLRTINREITCDKRNVTPDERDSAKEIIQNHQKLLLSITIKTGMEYGMNGCVRLERDENAVKLVQKQPIQMSQIPKLQKYYTLLTPYAFSFLKKQFEYEDKSADDEVIDVVEEECCENNDLWSCVVIEDNVSVEKYDVFVEVRTCGRPKGAVLTTIGLPKKRLRSSRKTETKTKKIGNRDIAVNSDEPTYCLCNQISYGEMICCDNDLCPVEWFHFSCVSLSTKPKGKWFCPKCRGDCPNKMKPKAQLLKELECYNKINIYTNVMTPD
ncbi:hypothetical protein AGLY_004990 [Aphis glycines]|uniref:PHD-type domain-containing protein n=1 Tax=Aphis glycines TaxID=307491 RepID=A0A6G0TVG7_APHGL|nr:hypothetical protein AGLY_004990 [Aphis glycines]